VGWFRSIRREDNSPFPASGEAPADDLDAIVFAVSAISMNASRDRLRQVYAFIGERLNRLPAITIARLDAEIRRTMWSSVYRELDTSAVRHLAQPADDPCAALTVLAMHGNGFARQEAVRQLAKQRNSRSIPVLLLRSRDWVAQVRDEARRAIQPLVDVKHAAVWVSVLPLVLRDTSREDTELREAVLDILRAPEASEALLEAFVRSPATTTRVAAKVALENEGIDDERLLATLRQQRDVKTSAIIVEGILDRLDDQDRQSLLEQLLDHPQVRMRRMALVHLARRFPDRAQPHLKQALYDTSTGTRRTAQDILAMKGLDVPGQYCRTLEDRPTASLYGLAETGSSADGELVAPYLASSDHSIRKAAVTAIARLAPRAHIPALERAILDPYPGMARAAATGLIHTDLDVDRLWELLTTAPDDISERNIIRVARAQAFWTRVHLAIRAAASDRGQVSEWGDNELHDTSLVHVPPLGDEAARTEITKLWRTVGPKLGDDARQFEFVARWLQGAVE
jgi:HEAT repeat protein